MASNPSVDKQLKTFLNTSTSAIIDLRPWLDFIAGHYINASHFYVDDLIERLFELPKRECPLCIIGDTEQLTNARRILNNKGYQVVSELHWSEQNHAQISDWLTQNKLWQQGEFSPQLWSPAKIVQKFQHYFAQKNTTINNYNQLSLKAAQDIPHKPSLLDLACGSGRDAIFMAQQGWQVTAVDYLADALSKVESMASRNQLAINTLLIDLEKNLTELLNQPQQYDCVQVIRYLHRPLLAVIKQKIKPGGYLVYQTFSQGCEAFGAPKKSRYILKQDELADFFSEFEIISDEIEYLADGRPTNTFIARKVV
jgi:tellurite methyltransferase